MLAYDETKLARGAMTTTLNALLARLRLAADADPYPPYEVRDRWLAALEGLVRDHTQDFADSIAADFGHRSPHETWLLEVLPSLEGIRHARHHLKAWMAPEPRRTSRWFLPGAASVHHEPLGVVGIMVPWNYPLYLALAPLVGALAAGNRVLLKLPETAPRTAALIERLLAGSFADGEVRAVGGDTAVGRQFARLPFDHLLFTGSTAVGREVMKAAAESLTPVTLELGGKSPAIVAEGYPMAHAAQRIVLGKCLNAGQTCIAPDYALVPADRLDDFLQEASRAASQLYPDPLGSPDYTAIVNDRHYQRLMGWLTEAEAAGARTVPLIAGSAPDPKTRRIPPVAVIGAPDHCTMMREEIFGPWLPVVGYDSLPAAIGHVATRPRPLALYYFDHDRGRIEQVLTQAKAGGVTINDVIYHIAQEDLPFGGLGASGMGRYHGRDGFVTFSNAKAVLHQSHLAPAGMLRPPYRGRMDRLIRFLASVRG
jgi:acyl-CoA reductase-like NAD-dependent aldehyde dehydrogenase